MNRHLCAHLFDSAKNCRSPIFMSLWPTEDVATVPQAIIHLRGQPSKPIALTPVQWGHNLKIVVEASSNPLIWLVHDESSGSWEADLAEIIRILGIHGIEAELALEGGSFLA